MCINAQLPASPPRTRAPHYRDRHDTLPRPTLHRQPRLPLHRRDRPGRAGSLEGRGGALRDLRHEPRDVPRRATDGSAQEDAARAAHRDGRGAGAAQVHVDAPRPAVQVIAVQCAGERVPCQSGGA